MAESKSGGGVSGRQVFNPNKIYNVSEEEMRAMQERAKMRAAMKQEFRKKVTNPYAGVGGYIVSDLHLFHMTFAVRLRILEIAEQTMGNPPV